MYRYTDIQNTTAIRNNLDVMVIAMNPGLLNLDNESRVRAMAHVRWKEVRKADNDRCSER